MIITLDFCTFDKELLQLRYTFKVHTVVSKIFLQFLGKGCKEKREWGHNLF